MLPEYHLKTLPMLPTGTCGHHIHMFLWVIPGTNEIRELATSLSLACVFVTAILQVGNCNVLNLLYYAWETMAHIIQLFSWWRPSRLKCPEQAYSYPAWKPVHVPIGTHLHVRVCTHTCMHCSSRLYTYDNTIDYIPTAFRYSMHT